MLTLLLLFCVLFLYCFFSWDSNYWQRRNVKSAVAFPFLGSYPKSAVFRQNIMYEQQNLYQKYKDKYRMIGVYERRKPKLLILDPQLINEIYVKLFKYFMVNDSSDSFNEILDPIFCKNLFAAQYEKWQKSRIDVSPAFTAAKIRPMHPLIMNSISKMISFIDKNSVETRIISAKDVTSRFTLDVCMKCIYGLESDVFEEQFLHAELVCWFSPSVLKNVLNAILSTFPIVSYIYKPSFFPSALTKWFYEIFDIAVSLRQKSNSHQNDFLAFLLAKNNSSYSKSDLAEIASMFFFNAFETTSTVLTEVLYNLASNMECQNKLRKEISDVLPLLDRSTSDIVEKLPYLESVLNESMRISPSAFLLAKKCTQAIYLTDYDGTRILIEPGTSVQIPIYAVHHDKQYYQHPNSFIPERFHPDSADVLKKNGLFLPFGDGPRVCLGRKFAVLQIKMAIVHLIRSYSISVNPKTIKPIVASPYDSLLTPISDVYLEFIHLHKDDE